MKKVLAFLLVAVMLVALCACVSNETSENPDTSVAGENSVGGESEPAESNPEESNPDESVPDESTPDESVPEESDDPVVDPSTGEVVEIPEDTNKYLSFGAPNTEDKITDADSVILTGYNTELSYGAVVLYDARYGATTPAGLEDYAVLVATYQAKPLFGYVKSAYYAVGEASAAVNIPADGFVVVVHKYQESDITALSAYTTEDSIYPHGIQVKDVSYSISYATTAPTVDGVVNANEYGVAVDKVEIDNDNWDYAQFAATEDYDIVADIYVTYDNDYLYFAVVVGMDYHFCPDADNIWDYCAIQVNTVSKSPLSDYMLEHYDHIVDNTALNDSIVRQYGFAVVEETNETVTKVFMAKDTTTTSEAKVVRDGANQQTIYEVKIAWTEIGFEEAPKAGDQFGLSFSINARDEKNDKGGSWKNVKLRNGGGIIGRNDWSKIPVVTLK